MTGAASITSRNLASSSPVSSVGSSIGLGSIFFDLARIGEGRLCRRCRPYAGPLWVIRYAFLTSHLIHRETSRNSRQFISAPKGSNQSRRNLKREGWTEFDLNQSLLSRRAVGQCPLWVKSRPALRRGRVGCLSSGSKQIYAFKWAGERWLKRPFRCYFPPPAFYLRETERSETGLQARLFASATFPVDASPASPRSRPFRENVPSARALCTASPAGGTPRHAGHNQLRYA